ncbi:LysM peptidoglycan-binding domain-containing protein [Xylanibacillus composti]|uniref:Peptidase M14 n=1 Tax=Xylanibacillus composti TaxID=1572762 RepID=A0A8J4H7R8_9BACL|nr:M14 family metallopeptidase [Xylanibacillus composti]MDT9726465.1 LysM peptidoglycan-binding domain-containing protein [Xylanibacillus composti]GIQ71397.1 peptidase M14 [Xylanibacillus composti]
MRITVRSGDSLWAISQWFQVPLVLLVDSNPAVQPQSLQPGQTLDVPGYMPTVYTVQPGDSLWSIAQSQGLPVDALLLANPGVVPASLYAGQPIALPQRVVQPIVRIRDRYDYAAMVEDLGRLSEVYPFLRQRTIGASVMGKPLPEVQIGRGAKRIHVNGSFHANEWITTPLLIRFLNDYLLAVTNQGAIRGLQMGQWYATATLSAVPMVNPDGVDLVVNGLPDEEPYRSEVLAINNGSSDFSLWKANIRGVDLNNQFPAGWEIEAERREQQPAPANYPGAAPLTEPEAQAIAQLTVESDFHRALAFHTQGEVIFWGFESLEPPESAVLVNEFARVSGYLPIQFVDSYAGYKDWFIQQWRRPGFTIEAGRGTNPLPFTQFEEIYQENLGILLASLYM